MKLLWIRPTTGKNVSTRRERIAEHLEKKGIDAEICNASGLDALSTIKTAVFGDHDLILGNVRIGLYLGYFLAILLRKPFIGDVSDPIEQINHLPAPLFRFFCIIEWWILERSEVCFFVESDTYEKALDRDINAILSRNSVNYAKFADPAKDVIAEADQILRDAGVNLNKPVAIYAGTLTTGVHLPEIADAAELTPGWEFVFLGEARGLDVATLNSSSGNLHFPGSFDHELVPGFFHRASAGLALVNVEQPQKIVEYGAAGLPTLAYPGRLKRLFSDQQVFFVDPDPEAISSVLEQIESNPEEANNRADNLQSYAREHRWEKVTEQYYQQILDLG